MLIIVATSCRKIKRCVVIGWKRKGFGESSSCYWHSSSKEMKIMFLAYAWNGIFFRFRCIVRKQRIPRENYDVHPGSGGDVLLIHAMPFWVNLNLGLRLY